MFFLRANGMRSIHAMAKVNEQTFHKNLQKNMSIGWTCCIYLRDLYAGNFTNLSMGMLITLVIIS